jgi:biopolymer transport protein ExbD
MRIPSPRSKKRSRIEIIPLIDIMFFLLATFMMVSMAMIRNQGINVHLPTASTSSAEDRKSFISITVTQKGDYFWDKESLTKADIPSRLKILKAAQGDPKIFINSDAKAVFEDVVWVLDEARKAGITKVAIETVKKP